MSPPEMEDSTQLPCTLLGLETQLCISFRVVVRFLFKKEK